MLKQGDIITLKNNIKYSVIFSTILRNENYVFLTNQENLIDSAFYKYDNSIKKLEIVKEEHTVKELLREYYLTNPKGGN